jgi:hypothetical protein
MSEKRWTPLDDIRDDVQHKLFGYRGWMEAGGGQVQVKWLTGHRDAVADIAAYSLDGGFDDIEAALKAVDGVYETRLIPYDGRLGRERHLRKQVRALMRTDGLDGRPTWPHTPQPRESATVTASGRIGELEAENERLRRELARLRADPVTAAVTGRLCACGCGQPVTSPRPEARYATGACRVRAHRAGPR